MRMLVIRRVVRPLLAVLEIIVVIRVTRRRLRRRRMTLGRHRATEADR